jgi:hypothetical protein
MRRAVGHWLRFALVIAGVVLPAAPSAANFVYTLSLKELYDEAEIVAALHIDNAEPQFVAGRQCGVRYDAHLLRVFKPTSPRALPVIHFADRGGDELSAGQDYFVTLKRIEDPAALYAWTSGSYTRWSKLADLRRLPRGLSREEALAFLGCNGLNAALHHEIAWVLADDSVVEAGALRLFRILAPLSTQPLSTPRPHRDSSPSAASCGWARRAGRNPRA